MQDLSDNEPSSSKNTASRVSSHHPAVKVRLVGSELVLHPSRSLHHSAAVWLLIPMKFWNILKQRLPVIRRAQMGYRRRFWLKRQKRTLTVIAELKRSVRYRPNPHHHYHHNPPSPVPGPSGTAVDACSKCAFPSFGTAKQPSKTEDLCAQYVLSRCLKHES